MKPVSLMSETDDRKSIEWVRGIIHKHAEAINFHLPYECIDSKILKTYREIVLEAQGDENDASFVRTLGFCHIHSNLLKKW